MPQYDIHLKDPKTGKITIVEDNFDYCDNLDSDGVGFTGAGWVIYMYTDGNYGCDCNRSNFMDIDELDCGNTIELIKIVEHGTDNVIWPEPPTVEEKYPGLATIRFVFGV